MNKGQRSFFKMSRDNPNVFYNYYNNKSFGKIIKILILWFIAIITLYFSILQLSVSEDYVLKPIIYQVFLFIPIEFILIYFFFEFLGSMAQRRRPDVSLLFPGSSNYKLNLSGFILILIIYTISIQSYMNQYRIQLLYSFTLLFFSTVFFVLGLNLFLRNKKFVLDKDSGYLLINGRTFYRKKYSITFHLDQPIVIAVQPYKRLLKPGDIGMRFSPRPEGIKDLRIMGVFLFLNEKRYLIYISTIEKTTSLAKQINAITNWKIIENDEIFYDTGFNLDLAIR